MGAAAGAGGDAFATQLSGGKFDAAETGMAGIFGAMGGALGSGFAMMGIKGNLGAASTGVMTTALQLQSGAASGASACGCATK